MSRAEMEKIVCGTVSCVRDKTVDIIEFVDILLRISHILSNEANTELKTKETLTETARKLNLLTVEINTYLDDNTLPNDRISDDEIPF